MLHRQTRSRNALLRAACSFKLQSIFIFEDVSISRAQTAKTLSQVKKVNVESFGEEKRDNRTPQEGDQATPLGSKTRCW
jgi:hypothetical protein